MRPDWTVLTEDGCELGVKVTEPVGPVRGEVLVLPAMMVDVRSLDRPPGRGLASVLAEEGFRVHRADLRGRGMSPMTSFLYEDLVYRDLPALVEALEQPWVLGHSLGGHVSAASWGAGCIDPRGLIGLGANIWMPSLEPGRRMRLKKGLTMRGARLSVRAFGGFPASRVGIGPVDEPGGYASDLARFWFDDRWGDRAGSDWLAGLRTIGGPALMVCSEGDRLLAHPDGATAFASRIPGVEVWRLRDGDLGMARAPSHMAMGVEAASEPLWRAIADWMKEAA